MTDKRPRIEFLPPTPEDDVPVRVKPGSRLAHEHDTQDAFMTRIQGHKEFHEFMESEKKAAVDKALKSAQEKAQQSSGALFKILVWAQLIAIFQILVLKHWGIL